MDTHLQASCEKDNLRRFYWNSVGKKYRIGQCLFVHRRQGLFLSVYVDDIKMAGRQQNTAPKWKKLMKNVDLEDRRECKPNEATIDQCREMFESRFSATATEKLPVWEKHLARTVAWSYDMDGPA